jgi:hypothetical protein
MKILAADSITGKQTSLDVIPISYVRHDDICMVKSFDKIFWYTYKENSYQPNQIPNVIIPVDNQDPSNDNGDRWVLTNIFIDVMYVNELKTNFITHSTSGDNIIINDNLTITPISASFDGTVEFLSQSKPFIINSDELVDNLNADLLDGYDSDHFITKEYGITSLPYPAPSGSISPSAGPRWIYLSFDKPAKNTEYSVFTTITNTVDPSASIYATTITEKTTAGFICEFSGDIDSPNYKLEYIAVGDFD